MLSYCGNRSQQKRCGRNAGNYRCYVTPERLNGHCDLLICEDDMTIAEWFCLRFSPEGLLRHTLIETTGIRRWLLEHSHKEITYLQAIRLLGDAVRQRYKYQKSTDWIPEDQSLHLQRIWQEEYYNDLTETMDWLLPRQKCGDMLQTYFRALNNKDAVLLYDLSAEPIQHAERRSLFAYRWNHELEGMHILNYEVDRPSIRYNDKDDYTLYLTVYGGYQERQLLEVDLRLRVIEEQKGFRILQEQVLEPRFIYKKLYC